MALKNKDRDKAMSFCRERKGLQSIESTLRGMQIKIEKQIMDIGIIMQTKDTLDVLNNATKNQQLVDDDIDEAEELIDTINEQNYNIQKINELFSRDVEGDEIEDEELLKELQEDEPEGIEDKNIIEIEKELDQYEQDGYIHEPAKEVEHEQYA